MHSWVFQRPQIALVLRTRAFLRSLKNSFVHVISKFHSKTCYYVPLRSRKHFPCFYRVRESTFIMPGGRGGAAEDVKGGGGTEIFSGIFWFLGQLACILYRISTLVKFSKISPTSPISNCQRTSYRRGTVLCKKQNFQFFTACSLRMWACSAGGKFAEYYQRVP
jgi:hypothetical protein